MKVFDRIGVPTISFQFTLLLSIFALIPIIFVCVLAYRMNDIQLTSTSIRLAEKTVSQVVDNIRTIIQSAENTAAVLSNDVNLQKAHNDFLRGVPLSTAIDHYIRLNKLFTYLNLNSNFYNIRVYLPDYDRITSEEYSIFGISKLDKNRIPISMKTEKQEYGWYGPYEFTRISNKEMIFTYFHKLFSYEQFSTNNSVICIDISVKKLREILLQDSNIEAIYILTDSDGKAVLYSDPDNDINGAIDEVRDTIEKNKKEDDLIIIPQKGLYYYRRAFVGSSGWQLIGLVPISQFRGNNKVVFYIAGIFIICLCMIPFVSYQVTKKLVKGINTLTVYCDRVRNGIYETIPVNGSTKEIQLLQETYNSMVKKIDTLIHDVYESTLAKQRAEMEFLYDQIKPHFLYNTLESAKWMAIKYNDMNVAKFIENISKYFKLTLNKGQEWITLEQELEQVDAYIRIMNARFSNRIHHNIYVDESVKDLLVLKLILQPIVENAIVHGIYKKDEFKGTVNIYVKELGENILISIEDDGVGMDDEMIDKLNQGVMVGFGIQNVRRRLELYYGDKYDIKFSKNQKMGTTVMITIPKLDRDKLNL